MKSRDFGSMDRALVKFIGSGMAAVSTGLGFTVPQSAMRNGFAIVSYLSNQKAAQTSTLIQEITADIWVNWGQGRVPRSAALAQLQGLPLIIATCCPPAGYFSSGLSEAAADAAKGNVDIAPGGRVIAAEIIMRGRESNAFEKAGLNEQLCYFLMERLFVQLLSRFELLDELKPTLQTYFLHKLWREAKPAAQEQNEALDAVSSGPLNARKNEQSDSRDSPAAAAATASTGAALLEDELDNVSEPGELTALAQRFETAISRASDADAQTLYRLQLGRANLRLGEIEQNDELLNNARELLAAGLVKPLLLDKAGIRRKAQIDLPGALWELSKINGERSLVEEAAVLLEPICKSLRPTGDLTLWVKAHSLLATIYQGLSRDQAGIEDLEKAAQNFEKAGELLSRSAQPVEWATLANKLSFVVELIGVRSNNREILAQAAEIKHAALDVFELHGDAKLLEALRDELYTLHGEVEKMNRQSRQPNLLKALSRRCVKAV